MNNMEKYLPLGTVVMLKNGKKRVMITGFAATAPETNGKMYDYMGCLYPEGVISSDKNLLFDHEQIGQIYHMGLVDEEWKQVEAKIKEVVAIKLSLPEEDYNKETESVESFNQLTEEVKEEPKFEVPSSENMFRVNTNQPTESIKEEPKVEVTSSANMFRINTDLFN